MMNHPYSSIFVLLIAFQLKQYLADFCLQYDYMLQKHRPGWDFIGPLSLHCFVHSMGTLIICLIFSASLWWLAVLDFILHFLMDRFRASPRMLGRFKDVKKASFWRILGFDQMFHHLTHYLIIWILITN